MATMDENIDENEKLVDENAPKNKRSGNKSKNKISTISIDTDVLGIDRRLQHGLRSLLYNEVLRGVKKSGIIKTMEVLELLKIGKV